MKKFKINLKSNRAFTMQDLTIAIIILILFAGTIGASFISVYKMQAQTKISAIATIYGVKIMENIDKITYSEVEYDTTSMVANYRNMYGIPEEINLQLNVQKYNEEDTIKIVTLIMNYEFSGEKEELVLERLKVKEI